MSFDWAQLSLLGDGGSTNCPRGRRVRDSLKSLGTKSGRRLQCEAWTSWAPTCSCVHQVQLPECFPPTLGALRLGGGGLAPVVHWLTLCIPTAEDLGWISGQGTTHGQRNLADYTPWGRKRVRCDLATNTTGII